MSIRTIKLEKGNWVKWTKVDCDQEKNIKSDIFCCSELQERLRSGENVTYVSENEGVAYLSLVENVVEFGPGGRVWDSAIVLASFLFSEVGSARLKGRSVLELGAGAGLTAILSVLLGASFVRATDKKFLIPLLEANASTAAPEQFAAGLIRAEALEWGQRLGGRKRRRSEEIPSGFEPDIVIASDVLGCGDASLYPPLLKTMLELCRYGAPILMSYKPRAKFELKFFLDAVDAGFRIFRLGRASLPENGISETVGTGESGTESFKAPIDLLEFRLDECVGAAVKTDITGFLQGPQLDTDDFVEYYRSL